MPRGPRGPFTDLSGNALAATLIPKLTTVRDKVWDLRTRLGAQPYTVSIVVTGWSGGRRNSGVEEVVSCVDITPTPTVEAMGSQTRTLHPVGLDEVGTVRVSGISPAYTEDELVGVGPLGQPIPADQNFYWEITFRQPTGQNPVRRRYEVRGTPEYNPTRFQWTVLLVKADENRDRNDATPDGD